MKEVFLLRQDKVAEYVNEARRGWGWGRTINAGEFGIFPDTGRETPVSAIQRALDRASKRGAELVFNPGHYFGNAAAKVHTDYEVLDLPAHVRVRAYGAEFQDFIWRGRGSDYVEFRGGRYFNKVSYTQLIHDIHSKVLKFIDADYDQEAPATGISPWVSVREYDGGSCEDLTFSGCTFRGRTNVHLWNVKNVTIHNCRMYNSVREDGFVIKSRKGYGRTEHVRISDSHFELTTGVIAAGTELGEDVDNIVATNCTLVSPQHILFCKPNASVIGVPDLTGGSIRNVVVSNVTAEDVAGEGFISLFSARVDDGSVVENVLLKNIAAKVRATTYNSGLGVFSLESDGPGRISNIAIDGFTLEDAFPGAAEPGDVDINGRVATGFAISRASTVQRLELDQYENISIRNGVITGVKDRCLDNEHKIEWENIIFKYCTYGDASPYTFRIHPDNNMRANNIEVKYPLAPERVFLRRLFDGGYGDTTTTQQFQMVVPELSDQYTPVYSALTRCFIVSVYAAFSEGVPAGVDNFAQFVFAIADVSGGVRVLNISSAVEYTETTAQGVTAHVRTKVFDAINAAGGHLPTPDDAILLPGETLLVRKANVGDGARVPPGAYTVNFVGWNQFAN